MPEQRKPRKFTCKNALSSFMRKNRKKRGREYRVLPCKLRIPRKFTVEMPEQACA